jgi:hypothetical protein
MAIPCVGSIYAVRRVHLTAVHNPIGSEFRSYCRTLGVTTSDTLATIMKAYDLQITADPANTKDYLEALEQISSVPFVGKESLQFRVATERSLNRYTTGEQGHLKVRRPC